MENGCNQGEMMFRGHHGMMRGCEENEKCVFKIRHHEDEGEGEDDDDCKDMEKCHKGEAKGHEASCCKHDSIMKK
jgi:hypothetical protein